MTHPFLRPVTSLSLALFWIGATGASETLAQSQQLVPIIRQGTSNSGPAVWNAFLQITQAKGTSFVSLSQVAGLLDGHLHHRPASKSVDFALRGRTIRFRQGSPIAVLDGKSMMLERAPLRIEKGWWVPASFFASSAFFRLTGERFQWPPEAPKDEKPAPAAKSVPAKAAPVKAATPPVSRPAPLPKRVEPPASPSDVTSTQAEAAALKAKALRRIVIDPGHGGKDPGTMSSRGVEEKGLNLLMAQELADQLREAHGYEVLLTRTDDTFIPLEDRAQLANKHNADLFISLHCNASLSPRMRGFEVYFLSERASDPHADAVARLENAPLALEGKSAPSPSQVQAVLRSLVKNAFINEASALGSLVERQVGKRTNAPTLGVKQAAFYVLRGAEMPSILIETGFLTNSKDVRQLTNEKFRKRLMEGIAAGIAAYDVRKQKERRPS